MTLPTKVIAGITVPSTPLVESAIRHAKAESPPWLFNHMMRSWLFAVKIAQIEDIAVDGEILAVASVLHDIGLVPRYRSPGRRFEVDGAAAAVSLIRAQCGEAEGSQQPGSSDYYKHRLREVLVWDAIALHTTSSLADHAVPEVDLCQRGVGVDFSGRGIERLSGAMDTVRAISDAFPRLGMKDEFRESLCALARDKPETTYDNWVGAFGEAYVDGYQRSKADDERVIAGLQSNFEK